MKSHAMNNNTLVIIVCSKLANRYGRGKSEKTLEAGIGTLDSCMTLNLVIKFPFDELVRSYLAQEYIQLCDNGSCTALVNSFVVTLILFVSFEPV